MIPLVLLSMFQTEVKLARIEVMREALLLSALTFLVTLIIGRPIINELRRRGIGKKIRIEGPQTHLVKEGTPTMGGIMIWLGVFLVNAIFNVRYWWIYERRSLILPLLVVLACGTLGAIDDLLNLSGGKSSGLTARFKFLWLTVIATGAGIVLHYWFELDSMYIPFYGKVPIGVFYIPIAIFVIVATSNAVNLSDGLDTLAGGLLALSFAAYGIIAFLQGQRYIVTLCFTTIGALLAFLWYNAHPAEVIMGDTGALSLGALLAVVALMTGQWLLLPIIGLMFVAITLSVILQVGYFKLTGGKRLFRMAPLHNHFELKGWAETQIAMRFCIVGVAAALVGVALALS